MAEDSRPAAGRKPYEAPRITWCEPLQAVAVICAKSDDQTCGGGPVAS